MLSVVFLAVFAAVAPASGQAPPPAPPKPSADTPLAAPVRIQVVIARYQGEKRISSFPYTMLVNAATRGIGQVRIGTEIPIANAAPPAASEPNKPAPAQPSVTYERIGTEMDCIVRPIVPGEARYTVELTISDRSVYADDNAPKLVSSMHPPLRSFRAFNTVVLRDGETTQFPAAADRMTGEVVRIEVTLAVVK